MSAAQRLPYVQGLRRRLECHDLSPADHYLLLRLEELVSADGYRSRHASQARQIFDDLSPSLRSDCTLEPPAAEREGVLGG